MESTQNLSQLYPELNDNKTKQNEQDAYENLCYNLFYSNHGFKKYQQAFSGLFENNAKAILEEQFQIKLP